MYGVYFNSYFCYDTPNKRHSTKHNCYDGVRYWDYYRTYRNYKYKKTFRKENFKQNLVENRNYIVVYFDLYHIALSYP